MDFKMDDAVSFDGGINAGVIESVHDLVLGLGLGVDVRVEGLRLEDVRGLPFVGSFAGAVQAHIVFGADTAIDLHADGEPVGVIAAGDVVSGVVGDFCTRDAVCLEDVRGELRVVLILKLRVNEREEIS